MINRIRNIAVVGVQVGGNFTPPVALLVEGLVFGREILSQPFGNVRRNTRAIATRVAGQATHASPSPACFTTV
jgi:hypothetical protein